MFAAKQVNDANGRIAVLTRQIRAEIKGAYDVLTIRRESLSAYQRELQAAGTELTRITQVAYKEGEIGILELLDSLCVSRAGRPSDARSSGRCQEHSSS